MAGKVWVDADTLGLGERLLEKRQSEGKYRGHRGIYFTVMGNATWACYVGDGKLLASGTKTLPNEALAEALKPTLVERVREARQDLVENRVLFSNNECERVEGFIALLAEVEKAMEEYE